MQKAEITYRGRMALKRKGRDSQIGKALAENVSGPADLGEVENKLQAIAEVIDAGAPLPMMRMRSKSSSQERVKP